MIEAPVLNAQAALPELLLFIGGLALLVVGALREKDGARIVTPLAVLVMVVAAFTTIGAGKDVPAFAGHFVFDQYAAFMKILILLGAAAAVLLAQDFMVSQGVDRFEYPVLVLFASLGMCMMVSADSLIALYMSLELQSLSLYVMAAFQRDNLRSTEAGLKYFILGALASGMLLYGCSLVYGFTGTLSFEELARGFAASEEGTRLPLGALVGLIFVVAGLAFKLGAVPFHMWTPDVYEGAPTAVTAFMSVGAKVGGFAALMRIFISALPAIATTWVPAVAVIAALTMILGNVVALAQSNIKRMLAYSSIAHAGYILMGVAAGISSPEGVSAALFYMLAYLFTNLGAFAIVIAVERRESVGNALEDFKGLAKRAPLLSLAMATFMLSLTGVPPTGGFSGKFYIFRAALEADLAWLAIVGVVTSIISGYFYLRVVYLMFMYEGEGEVSTRPALNTAVALTVLGTLLLGFLPTPWFTAAQQAILHGVQALAGG